jgi:hypothetical protein
MFQKSCLLKCISTATNEHSIFEHNYGLYTLKRQEQSSLVVEADKTKLSGGKRSTKEWRDSFKKSFNSTIKKSYRRIKKAHPSSIASKAKKVELASQSMASIDMFKKANVFSSTLVNNVTKCQPFEVEKSTYLFAGYADSSDDSDDDESDLDISMDQNDYDLNSSLSSVSSLEFEPFESSSSSSRMVSVNTQHSNLKKSIVKPPLISSSRSNITASTYVSSSSSNESDHSRLINFESCTTSSRLSLLSSESTSQRANATASFVSYANLVRKQENDCSMCNNHQIDHICSSTMINNTLNCNNTNIDFILSTSRVSMACSITNNNINYNNNSRNSSSLSAYSSCSSLNDSLNNQTVFKKN